MRASTASADLNGAVDARALQSVRRKRDDVERRHGVHVPFSVGSGIRTWGFPSSDSGYDVRFICLNPRDGYFSPVERRDVIEIPIDAEGHDISGWDFRKALRLFLRSNAPLHERVVSPIVYRDDGETRAALHRLAERGCASETMGRHDLRLADRTYRTHLRDRSEVSRKWYFSVVRPLCALCWRVEQGTLPPMNLSAVWAGLSIPKGAQQSLDRLLHRRKASSEAGSRGRRQVLDRWIERRLEGGVQGSDNLPGKTPILAEAEAFRRKVLDRPFPAPRSQPQTAA